MLKKKI